MSQYTNFIQFGGESDDRCAQVTQLLAAAWAQHSDGNSLVVIQLDIVNAYPSTDWQAQFDVLAGRASRSYDNGHVQLGDDIPCPSSWARGSEAQRAEAAARHQGRSTFRGFIYQNA